MICPASILIAEDDENDRYLLLRAFGKTEFRSSVTVACDGQEAVDYLASLPPGQTPKLLLLDLKMPRMNGFQVLEWLLNHPDRRPSRVVVLSSSVDPGDAQRSRLLNADLHLSKPHDSIEFVRITTGLLEQLPCPIDQPLTSSLP